MSLHYLPLVIPFLFVLIWFEYQYNKKHHSNAYRFETTVLNISCGIIERIFDIFILAGIYVLYNALQSNMSIFNLSNAWWVWLLCFIAVDFMVYWYHRAGHRINFLWASHVAHHQCEEYNLTVAFRNHVLPNIFRGVFLGILPIIGFSGTMVVICLSISGLYQFLLHTESVRKLGWLEHIVTTPSTHRVHHASNKAFLDKNFGGFFIFWDKLFGTYAQESGTIKYGITSGYSSLNPVVSYTHVWVDLFKMNAISTGWNEKIKIWFGVPEHFYDTYSSKLILTNSTEQIQLKKNSVLMKYVSFQLALTIILSISVLVFEEMMTSIQLIWVTGSLILSAISISTLMGNVKFITIEKIRVILIGSILILSFKPPIIYVLLIVLLMGFSFFGLMSLKKNWHNSFVKNHF